jgi:hypothetical protein
MKSLMKGRRNAPKKKRLLAWDYMDGPADVHSLLPPQQGTFEDVAAEHYDVEDNKGVRTVEDKAIDGSCIELTDAAEMTFENLRTQKRYLTLFIKNVNRFCELQIELVQRDGAKSVFIMSNNQSVTRIDRDQDKGGGTCTLPMILKQGWNYLNIDLETLLASAFGTQYERCESVTVLAECRVSRLFFQKRMYADVELPDHIRLAL